MSIASSKLREAVADFLQVIDRDMDMHEVRRATPFKPTAAADSQCGSSSFQSNRVPFEGSVAP
jgi:hypothetical protein